MDKCIWSIRRKTIRIIEFKSGSYCSSGTSVEFGIEQVISTLNEQLWRSSSRPDFLCHVGATGNANSADSTSFQVPNVGTFLHARACVILRPLDSGPRSTDQCCGSVLGASHPESVQKTARFQHYFLVTTWANLNHFDVDFEVQEFRRYSNRSAKSQFLLARFLYHHKFWKNIKFIVVHQCPCKSNAFSIKNIGLASAGKIGSGKAPVELEVPNPKSG